MGFWDGGGKVALPGILVSLGAVLAAPVILPALAGIARPAAKEIIRLALGIADDIQEVVANHHPWRGKPAGLVRGLLQGQAEDLVAEELGEAAAEETLTETVLEGIVEIL